MYQSWCPAQVIISIKFAIGYRYQSWCPAQVIISIRFAIGCRYQPARAADWCAAHVICTLSLQVVIRLLRYGYLRTSVIVPNLIHPQHTGIYESVAKDSR